MARHNRKKARRSSAEVSPKQALAEKLAERLVVGQRVRVVKEDGEEIETFVTGYPWQTGYDEWVVGLEGFPVAYDITRVRPVEM